VHPPEIGLSSGAGDVSVRLAASPKRRRVGTRELAQEGEAVGERRRCRGFGGIGGGRRRGPANPRRYEARAARAPACFQPASRSAIIATTALGWPRGTAVGVGEKAEVDAGGLQRVGALQVHSPARAWRGDDRRHGERVFARRLAALASASTTPIC
jgi:hypothetical protein